MDLLDEYESRVKVYCRVITDLRLMSGFLVMDKLFVLCETNIT